MKPLGRYRGDYRWAEIPREAYEPGGTDFLGVTRQVLFGRDTGLTAELRYFEVACRGHTNLERHEHAHAVVILRGKGRVLVGREILAVRPFDLVRVAAMTWHQFRAGTSCPLGFLCLVDAERDRPQYPTPKQLATLRRDPQLAAFIRV
jgi:quercetin dioxygenase-like cupin family protein